VFSDDIEWCKNNFKIYDKDIYFIDDINNVSIELILMSFFKHNIIANSSYSWWTSYISNYDDNDKIVIAPQRWFGQLGPRQWKDMYLPNWIVI
jgi:hypothetical protein